jgi:hypothetical protein
VLWEGPGLHLTNVPLAAYSRPMQDAVTKPEPEKTSRKARKGLASVLPF